MSSLRRGVTATVAALAAVSLLAGCGDSSTSATDYAPLSDVEYAPVDGISLDSTVVRIRNLYALADEGPLAPRLRMTLVNTTTTDDALVGATLGRPAVTGRLIGGTAGTLPINAGTSVIVGSDGGAQITFPGLDLKAGTYVPVTLLFRDGRAVAGSILVQSAVSLYSDGTVPQGRPSDLPVQPVLPSGEAVNPAAEEAQVQQGVEDQGHNTAEH